MLYNILLLFSAILGFFVSSLIVQKLLKRNNSFTESLCRVKGNFNCNAVLDAPLGKLNRKIHLADIALVYFMAQSLFLLFSIINNQQEVVVVLLMPVTGVFISTFYLLWYQARIIKNWCSLCLLLTTVIWLQAIASFFYVVVAEPYLSYYYVEELLSVKTLPSFFTGIVCILIGAAWLFIKQLVANADELTSNRKQLIVWKNNIAVFLGVLRSGRRINTQLWDEDFILGNKLARLKFIAATNPYCPACAREYKYLAELLKLYGNDIAIIMRFGVHSVEKSERNQAVQYLVYSYTKTPKDKQAAILEKWFASSDLNSMKKEFPDIELTNKDLLKKYEQWFIDTDIKHTPTLFLNGYEVSQPYRVSDLKAMIPRLLKSYLSTQTA